MMRWLVARSMLPIKPADQRSQPDPTTSDPGSNAIEKQPPFPCVNYTLAARVRCMRFRRNPQEPMAEAEGSRPPVSQSPLMRALPLRHVNPPAEKRRQDQRAQTRQQGSDGYYRRETQERSLVAREGKPPSGSQIPRQDFP